uniref:Uncharacterized protein n=1 Tax=Timema cristinae TaxID=61476 RepID=A0A7R9D5R9_TIMCR|nr:unnamed protein product [Timema cristinae]
MFKKKFPSLSSLGDYFLVTPRIR